MWTFPNLGRSPRNLEISDHMRFLAKLLKAELAPSNGSITVWPSTGSTAVFIEICNKFMQNTRLAYKSLWVIGLWATKLIIQRDSTQADFYHHTVNTSSGHVATLAPLDQIRQKLVPHKNHPLMCLTNKCNVHCQQRKKSDFLTRQPFLPKSSVHTHLRFSFAHKFHETVKLVAMPVKLWSTTFTRRSVPQIATNTLILSSEREMLAELLRLKNMSGHKISSPTQRRPKTNRITHTNRVMCSKRANTFPPNHTLSIGTSCTSRRTRQEQEKLNNFLTSTDECQLESTGEKCQVWPTFAHACLSPMCKCVPRLLILQEIPLRRTFRGIGLTASRTLSVRGRVCFSISSCSGACQDSLYLSPSQV